MKNGKKAAVFGGFLALALMVGCSSQTATHNNNQHGTTSTEKVAKASAEDIFKQNCASCHGQNLEGYVGPNLQKVGGKMDEKQILEVIEKGKGQMPGGLVSEEDAKSLAAWLANKK